MQNKEQKLKCEKCHLKFGNRHEKLNHEAKFCFSSSGKPTVTDTTAKLLNKQEPSSYLDEVKKLFVEIDKRFAFITEDQAKYSEVVWRRQNDKPIGNLDEKIRIKNNSSFIKKLETVMDFLAKKDEMQLRFEQDVSSLQSKVDLLQLGDGFSAERRQIYLNLIEYRRRIQRSELRLFEQIEHLRVRYLKIKLLFYKSETQKFEDDLELVELLEVCEKSKREVFERKGLYENALEALNKNTRFTVPDLKSFDQYYDNEILKNIMRMSLAKIKHLKNDHQMMEKELMTGSEYASDLPAKKHPFIYLAQRNILEENPPLCVSNDYLFSKEQSRNAIDSNQIDFVHFDTDPGTEENPNDITYF